MTVKQRYCRVCGEPFKPLRINHTCCGIACARIHQKAAMWKYTTRSVSQVGKDR